MCLPHITPSRGSLTPTCEKRQVVITCHGCIIPLADSGGTGTARAEELAIQNWGERGEILYNINY